MQNWQGGPPQGGYPGGYGGQQPQQQQPQQQQPQQQQPQQPGGYGPPQQPAGYPQQGQQVQQGQQPFGVAVPHVSAEQGKGFAKALFDFSFRNSIGPTVIKILYGVVCLGAVGVCLMGLYQVYYNLFERYYGADYGDAVLSLLSACIGPVVVLVVGRLYCEILASIFRIADNLQEMNDRGKSG